MLQGADDDKIWRQVKFWEHVTAYQQAEVTMDRIMGRIPGAAALIAHGGPAATSLLFGVLMLAPIAQPALAQNAAPPGSTINGTVPSAEGNVWNGLDHQPTPADAGPTGNAQQQARINHKLSKLDQELLNDPLPRIPAGAPAVTGN